MVRPGYCGFIHSHLERYLNPELILRAYVRQSTEVSVVLIVLISHIEKPNGIDPKSIGWVRYQQTDMMPLKQQLGLDSLVDVQFYYDHHSPDVSVYAYRDLFHGTASADTWFEQHPEWAAEAVYYASKTDQDGTAPLVLDDPLLHAHLGILEQQLAARHLLSSEKYERAFFETLHRRLQIARQTMRATPK